MAKIAVTMLAHGPGWSVEHVICNSGPRDRPFEERHQNFRIALVAAGSFQYRSDAGRALMTPGSVLLGNTGRCFECGHEHGTGDRCISFGYDPDYFEQLAGDAGTRPHLDALRLPPLRDLAPLAARTCAGLTGGATPWQELGVQLAARVLSLASGIAPHGHATPAAAAARVTRAVRTIDHDPAAPLDLASLATQARLSPYHFLRMFQQLTGLTPHQYILRARLRAAAVRLTTESARILDIALDSGFGDVSNFNRAFRTEFGISPRQYRSR